MKLTKIRLEKFRGIRVAEITVGSELALVGQNSAGKSSILRALNAFFNFSHEEEAFETSRHSFQKSSTAIIDLEFTNVPDQFGLSRTANGENTFRARLKFRKAPTWQLYVDGQWVTAPQDFQTELQKYIRYVYVPIARTDNALKWGQESLLQSAVLSWVKEHTKNRDRISPKVAELTRVIKERTFDGLSKYLRSVTHLNGSFEFELD